MNLHVLNYHTPKTGLILYKSKAKVMRKTSLILTKLHCLSLLRANYKQIRNDYVKTLYDTVFCERLIFFHERLYCFIQGKCKLYIECFNKKDISRGR